MSIGEHVVTLELAKELKGKSYSVVPGWKLCRKCYTKTAQLGHSEQMEGDDEAIGDLENSYSKEEAKRDLEQSFEAVGVSPLKIHSLPKRAKLTATKNKLEKAYGTLQEKVRTDLLMQIRI